MSDLEKKLALLALKNTRGEPGPRGVSVKFIGERDGQVIAELDDGTVFPIVSMERLKLAPKGEPGERGKTGVGIDKIVQEGDSLRCELTDGTVMRFVLPRGPKGDEGARGVGLRGDKGDKGDMPAHQWNGTKLRFENPDGTWGKWVDLQGEPGEKGDQGYVIRAGSGGMSSGGGVTEQQVQQMINDGREVFVDAAPAKIVYTSVPNTDYYEMNVHVL